MKVIAYKTVTLLLISLMILFSLEYSKKKLSITTKEKEEGYRAYKDMGLKFKLSDIWKVYDDNLLLYDLGNNEDENNPIYSGRKYEFFSKDMFSILVFRENMLDNDIELSKLTNMEHNKNISNISGYSFYFCYNGFDDTDLSEEAKIGYKAMYADIENIKASLTTYKPMTAQKARRSI